MSAVDFLELLLYGPVTSVATVGPGTPTVASTASEPEHDTAHRAQSGGPVKNTAS